MQSSILHFEVESDSSVHVYPTLQSGYAYKVSLRAGALRESLRKKKSIDLSLPLPMTFLSEHIFVVLRTSVPVRERPCLPGKADGLPDSVVAFAAEACGSRSFSKESKH